MSGSDWIARPLYGPRHPSELPARIKNKIAIVGTCWEWQGSRSKLGYGRVNWGGHAVNRLVHRVIWELLVGPVPAGLELDHICRNPPCCNPWHLEPVTHKVNLRRGKWPQKERTHCPQGHEYTPENTYAPPSRPNARYCKACHRMRYARTKRARENG